MDEGAPLGVATTRSMERVAAAVGLLQEAPIEFEPVADVPLGGVLCALPALLAFGLLRHTRENFTLPPGFYPIETIFLVVAFLALARIRSLEALRYQAPGEWGKLLGLDRVPEVKTLREKLGILCAEPERPRAWSSTLARDWMEATPESAGTLYIDGACLSRSLDPAATPLRLARAALSARHHRLLGQRHGRPALFRRHPSGR